MKIIKQVSFLIVGIILSTHCYMLTFNSEMDTDSIHTPHPDHQAFVASLQPHLEKVFVVDYWTNP